MPLSRPVRRRLVHTRRIRCEGYEREDGLWDIEAALVDTKTYSFDNVDRDGVAAGEPIHKMLIRLTVDAGLTVTAVEAATEAGPFAVCGDIVPAYRALEGRRIGPGWQKTVRDLLGKTKGCTHITDLLLGPLAATAFQTVAAARKGRETAPEAGAKPPILDTCHALATSSPVVKRHWPEHYTGS